jgi:hypothetical protein
MRDDHDEELPENEDGREQHDAIARPIMNENTRNSHPWRVVKNYRKIRKIERDDTIIGAKKWRMIADLYREIRIIRFWKAESRYFLAKLPEEIALFCLSPLFREVEALLRLYSIERDREVLSDCRTLIQYAEKVYSPKDHFCLTMIRLSGYILEYEHLIDVEFRESLLGSGKSGDAIHAGI